MVDACAMAERVITGDVCCCPCCRCAVQMVVPSADTVRFSYLLETCLDVGRSVLFAGITGVGKSVIAGAALHSLAAKSGSLLGDAPSSRVAGRLLTHTVVFSAQTSSSDVQFAIESKLDKKRKKRYVVWSCSTSVEPLLSRHSSPRGASSDRLWLDVTSEGCHCLFYVFQVWRSSQHEGCIFHRRCQHASPRAVRRATTHRTAATVPGLQGNVRPQAVVLA